MSELEVNTESSPAPAPSAPDFAVATQPSYARTLFLGPHGLRPGWGLAFYALTFLMLQRLAADLAASRDLGASGLWSMMLAEFGSLVAAAIPAVVLARVERRPWSAYGLPGKQAFGRLFWIGSLWGFAGISLLMFALYGLHAFAFGHVVLHGSRLTRFALFWAAMFLLVGLFEEFLLRGYTQFTLARGIGFWPAALVLSCAFGLIHLRNGGEQWNGLLAAALIGLFFCLTLRRTGNLWFAVGFHAAWDWGETFFYSVPDSGMVSPGHLLSSSLRGPSWISGGSVGPEGSVLCFLVIAFLWIAFDRICPRLAVRLDHATLPLPAKAGSSSLRSSE
ncbi:MAG TPA: type II CAAX endopeptidase family protein [Candidatus Sulfotelmatobacter sp.]|nr:type II CAAX endopeptidase family protein [Candidatus Sulfotelmatobacter sp.]